MSVVYRYRTIPAGLGPLYEFDGNLVADVLVEKIDETLRDGVVVSRESAIVDSGKRAVAMRVEGS